MTSVEASRKDDAIRQAVVYGVLAFLADQDGLALQQIRDARAHEIDVAGPHALLALKARLTTEAGWEYYEPDPLVRRIHDLLGRRFLRADWRVIGAEFITLVAPQPVAIFANHLSYGTPGVGRRASALWRRYAKPNRGDAAQYRGVYGQRDQFGEAASVLLNATRSAQ